MSEEEEQNLDVSMWPDSRLRPWTIDDELDAKIDAENLSLDDRVLKTSVSKLAGKSYFLFENLVIVNQIVFLIKITFSFLKMLEQIFHRQLTNIELQNRLTLDLT